MPHNPSFCDLIATLLNLLKVEPPYRLDGRDLMPLIAGSPCGRDHVISGFQDYTWMRNRNYAFVARNDGASQSLFDLPSDGGQLRNIAGEAPQVANQMFQQAIEGAGGSVPVYGAGRQMDQWYQPLIEGQH